MNEKLELVKTKLSPEEYTEFEEGRYDFSKVFKELIANGAATNIQNEDDGESFSQKDFWEKNSFELLIFLFLTILNWFFEWLIDSGMKSNHYKIRRFIGGGRRFDLILFVCFEMILIKRCNLLIISRY